MKHHMSTKIIAVILAVLCGAAAIMSGICVFCNLNYGLYTNSPEELAEQYLTEHASYYAEELAEEYAMNESGMPREVWENYMPSGYIHGGWWPYVDYELVCSDGGSASGGKAGNEEQGYCYTTTVTVTLWTGYAVQIGEDYRLYPEYLGEYGMEEEIEPTTMPAETTEPDVTVPTVNPVVIPQNTIPAPTDAPDGYWLQDSYAETSDGNIYRVYRKEEPTDYTVKLLYTEEDYNHVVGQRYGTSPLMDLMYQYRFIAIGVFCGTLIVLILMMIYLACAAGRKPDSDEVRPAGLNLLPLDLYTGLDLFIGFWLVWLLFEPVMGELFDVPKLWDEAFILLSLCAVGLCLAISLLCVLYWCALCAQLKADGFWWKKSLLGRFGDGIWSFIKRIFRKIWGWILGLTGKVGDNLPSLPELLRDFNDKLPLMWQWLAASLVIFGMLALFGTITHNVLGKFLYLIIVGFAVAAILYGARAFGALRDAAKRMSQGQLDVKINPDTLEGCFKDFAKDLNELSDACIHAAREQMKSERMKTELITNVSHDIKTPLTSIINYVDLLKKAETEAERQEYLEVLDRQSARLKKLIEDLMEMSKASTGNVATEIVPTDVVESVNQALGEYADRFDRLGLNVVFRKPASSVIALCDGKLLWRVLSNVMSNIVKYAMPHTRVYLDLSVTEYKVQLALKNISREELNISAEELMERFVRGDESRNTEGNGLGLNIAKSLMEVQNGTLELVVDGDLFKVVLTLQKAENAAMPILNEE